MTYRYLMTLPGAALTVELTAAESASAAAVKHHTAEALDNHPQHTGCHRHWVRSAACVNMSNYPHIYDWRVRWYCLPDDRQCMTTAEAEALPQGRGRLRLADRSRIEAEAADRLPQEAEACAAVIEEMGRLTTADRL